MQKHLFKKSNLKNNLRFKLLTRKRMKLLLIILKKKNYNHNFQLRLHPSLALWVRVNHVYFM